MLGWIHRMIEEARERKRQATLKDSPMKTDEFISQHMPTAPSGRITASAPVEAAWARARANATQYRTPRVAYVPTAQGSPFDPANLMNPLNPLSPVSIWDSQISSQTSSSSSAHCSPASSDSSYSSADSSSCSSSSGSSSGSDSGSSSGGGD